MFDYSNRLSYATARSPKPNEDYTPQGFNVVDGNNVSGRSSPNTFYLSTSCSSDESCISGWEFGFGDVPQGSKFGMGGATPIVIDGLKFGAENIYKRDAQLSEV